MKQITLYRGCNNDSIPALSWWSDNYETVEHYFEGCVLAMTIILDDDEMDYVRDDKDLPADYTYGHAEMNCPKGAIWYSFDLRYILTNYTTMTKILSLDTAKKEMERTYGRTFNASI